MNTADQNALLTIALLAAFADGSKADAERAEVRRVAESLATRRSTCGAVSGRAAQTPPLSRAPPRPCPRPELKQLAFELAVGVCDADGLRNEAETRFLAELGQALGLTQPQIAEPAATADALATMPLEGHPRHAGRGNGREGRNGCRGERGTCRRERRGPQRRRARQDDPQLLDTERGAGVAAAVDGEHGHHSAADEDGLPDRQGARLRARPGPHQRPAGHDGRGTDRPVPRGDRPQGDRRLLGKVAGRMQVASRAARPAWRSRSQRPTRWGRWPSATTPAAAPCRRRCSRTPTPRCSRRPGDCRRSTRRRSSSRPARWTSARSCRWCAPADAPRYHLKVDVTCRPAMITDEK